ncbi:hypothetical protein GNY06_02370 [Elizabethkingia argentiflava]|uniref:Uncharacterized protein n=1 Tax=Elizabethkingia argenteiflava TaxID=2681556 RepID=A0A845PUW9_9FLAO|nr:hypothetical protein [Elizabethkingia argenteiflava]NAW50277.1 hypothetical protein [Elizabethkingia argenteiflava]
MKNFISGTAIVALIFSVASCRQADEMDVTSSASTIASMKSSATINVKKNDRKIVADTLKVLSRDARMMQMKDFNASSEMGPRYPPKKDKQHW